MALRQTVVYDANGISIMRESMGGPDGYDIITIDDSEFSEGVAIPVEFAAEVAKAILEAASIK